jgi:hypothetical protein
VRHFRREQDGTPATAELIEKMKEEIRTKVI